MAVSDEKTMAYAGRDSRRPDALASGEVFDGRYRIVRALGRGATGVVYQSVHLASGRPVAVKRLDTDRCANAAQVERFQREARAVSAVRSPHVVGALEFGRASDGAVYFAMELLEGTDLAGVLRGERERGHAIPIDRVLRLMDQICAGLAAVHAAGFVHRDLKPANVFVARGPDGGDLVKLLDFGLAKLRGPEGAQAELTRTGAVLGTPQYMAPEQIAESKHVGPAADVYALGCIAFEMLAGHPPFSGDNPLAILGAHLYHPPPPARDLRGPGKVPRGFERVVERALDKDPARRPRDAGEFRAAMAAAAVVEDWTRSTALPRRVPPRWLLWALIGLGVALLTAAIALALAHR